MLDIGPNQEVMLKVIMDSMKHLYNSYKLVASIYNGPLPVTAVPEWGLPPALRFSGAFPPVPSSW